MTLLSIRCLRIVVAIQCLGIAGRYLLIPSEQESSIYGLLFFDLGWHEGTAQAIDDTGGWICLLAAIVVGLNFAFDLIADGRKNRTRLHRCISGLELLLLGFVSLWFLSLASAEMMRGGVYTEWAIPEQAVRIISPVALAIALAMGLALRNQANSPALTKVISGMLQIAVAATFAVHGYKAIVGYGPFVDLILLSEPFPFLGGVSQSTAERWLWIVGWIDVGLALAIVCVRWRSVALYMAFWGFLTAASRMLALGFEAWPESLIRVANGGAPLALFFLFQHLKQVKMSVTTHVSKDLPEDSI